MRTVIALAVLLILALVLAIPVHAHGGDEDLAEQPAKVLVQQALALLRAGQNPAEAAERLDAAERSEKQKGVDPDFLAQGHEALEQGDIDGAIRLLKLALAGPPPAAETDTDEADQPPPARESAPAPTAEPPSPEPPKPDATPQPPGPEQTEAPEASESTPEEAPDQPGDTEAAATDEFLESDEARENIFEHTEPFRPDRANQELAAAIGGGLLLAAAIGGIGWRRRRDSNSGS